MATRRTTRKKKDIRIGLASTEQARENPKIANLTPFIPQVGPQTDILFNPTVAKVYEILGGGSKGGGKTAVGRAWLFRGNPEHRSNPRTDADLSYVFHPNYRALVLRRNRDDLNDWVARCEPMAKMYGGEWHVADSEFVFQSGAKIIVAHLADGKAYFSFEGNEIHSLLIEELTHIPEYSLYANVKKNIRTEHPELHPQILCTTNPPGPGHFWVKERFITPCPAGNMVLREWVRDPITGDKKAVDRIFIPMRLHHNKILLKSDPSYAARLMSDLKTDEERRAYIDGDWDAMSGLYFRNFRPQGPRRDEPPEAKHVFEPGEMPIMSWWPRVLAMDVGFEHHAVVLKAAIRPEGRLHIYGEMAETRVDNEEWGVRIAQWVWNELRGMTKPVIVVWMSHDAFGQKGDPNTRAEQIEAGIKRVAGPESTIIMNEGADGAKFLESLRFQTSEARIVLRRAPRQRIDGWQFLHGLMRFKQLPRAEKSLYNHEYAQQLLEEEGFEKYCEYRQAFQDRPKETLPRLIIENCPGLVKAIPGATRQDEFSPTGTGSKPNSEDIVKTKDVWDDYRDTVRYLAMGFKHQTEIEPPDVFVDERVAAALRQDPYLDEKAIFDIRVRGYEDYGRKITPVAFNVGRGSPRRQGVRIVQ